MRTTALLVCLLVTACGGGGPSEPAPPPPTAQPPPQPPTPEPQPFSPGTRFVDTTAATGIERVFNTGDSPIHKDEQRMAGGLAAADFDDDGDIDIFVVGGAGNVYSLFRNDGDNRFTEMAADVALDVEQWGSGPAFGDIDGDRDLDLFVGSIAGSSPRLFRNDAGMFIDMTASSGLAITAASTISATFADYDQDGDLDLFLSHWGNEPQPDTESLWRNDGSGSFTSASVKSGLADQLITMNSRDGLTDYSFTGTFSDIDGDGDPDLLITSDFKTSKVFRNNGDATFTDITETRVIIDQNGMGSAVGDYDNDGDMDWFVTSIIEQTGEEDDKYGNRLYVNNGLGAFIDATPVAGVDDGGWGWGACMEDFDNDGDLDLFHVNGWPVTGGRGEDDPNDYSVDRVRYFENQGDSTFVETAEAAGLTDRGQGRGGACFDSDRDGDLDLLITNNQGEESVVFYENQLGEGNHYLAIRLTGSGVNTHGIGSWVEVRTSESTQVREIRAGNHYVSQNPAEAHFGLGGETTADVKVRWPDGSETNLTSVAVDRLLDIEQKPYEGTPKNWATWDAISDKLGLAPSAFEAVNP